MNRPWQIAATFVLCLAVVLAALAWTSHQVLRLDRAEAAARRQAQEEENVRLALWRMESALGPLAAQESSRPYFEYAAFYPAERAYTKMFNRVGKGEIMLPSPLLSQPAPYVLLNFQIGPDGELTSPQVPTGNMRDLAESGYTNGALIEEAIVRLVDLKKLVSSGLLSAALPPPQDRSAVAVAMALPSGQQNVAPQRETANQGQTQAPQQRQPSQQPAQAQRLDTQMPNQQAESQVQRNAREWQARAQFFQNNDVSNLLQAGAGANTVLVPPDVREGAMKPVWLNGALVLARRVSVSGREYVQGAWLDWPAIRKWLLESARDLVPEADLVPVKNGAPGEGSRLLAALPVRLIPGAVPLAPEAGLSPLRLSLIVAWVCVILAGAAVAVLLWASVALSERRAAFVSAVTHELRTPLTTFRMYSEMLAAGMVADEAKRRRYLDTLRIEADRLSHLVENVLAYARLERGRARGRVETVTVGDLVDRVRGRLAERARQAGMELVAETRLCEAGAGPDHPAASQRRALVASDGAVAMQVRADASAVEQILLNLVDNACKYAVTARDRRIHLVAETADGRAVLKVCDHGPGISREDGRRLFRPFSKSARDAANSAPGVGLGLALSRRLARDMGGDLALDPSAAEGACFVLRLARA